MTEDIWEKMVEKYGVTGYDNSSVIINYKTLIDLTEKAEKIEAVQGLKDELDEQIDFIERASRTHGLLQSQKAKHEFRQEISGKLKEILGAEG